MTAECNGDITDPKCRKNSAYARFKRGDVGTDYNETWYQSYGSQMGVDSTFYLPFIPSREYNFDNQTLSLNATHPDSGFTQYNVHSLFGHVQSQ